MRNEHFAVGEFYHLYNRGVDKRQIFSDDHDKERFLKTLRLCRDIFLLPRSISETETSDPETATVNIHAFCLMDNHFHLLVEQTAQDGVSKFMQRVGNSYTKYFNLRHGRSGRLFQNAYKCERATTDSYFTYLASYIHSNPADLPTVTTWEGLESYPWSSYGFYVDNVNTWVLKTKITSLFSTIQDLKTTTKQHCQHRMLTKGVKKELR